MKKSVGIYRIITWWRMGDTIHQTVSQGRGGDQVWDATPTRALEVFKYLAPYYSTDNCRAKFLQKAYTRNGQTVWRTVASEIKEDTNAPKTNPENPENQQKGIR